MTVTVAQGAGFCFGVQRAVDMAYAAAASHSDVVTLGELIHNPIVVGELAAKGLHSVELPTEDIRGKTVIIRSHGVGPEIYRQLEALDCKIIDATCPFVEKLHKCIQQVPAEGVLIMAGDPKHPEVVGALGYCKGTWYCFQTEAQLLDILEKLEKLGQIDCYFAGQTTFDLAIWGKSVKFLKKVYTNAKIFDTICNATEHRQKISRELAARCDAMVVVGGAKSSNTRKLAAICEQFCPTYPVEQADELLGLDFSAYSQIGVTAGASTPVRIIKEVQETMSDIVKDQGDLSFGEMLDQTFKTINNGDKVTGIVTRVAPNEIFVDVGTKHAGFVPLKEITDDPDAKAESLVKVGDELELLVVRVNDVEGTVMLSKKRVEAAANFERLMNGVDSGEAFEGTVMEIVNGGMLAYSNGVRVFIPDRSEDLSDYMRKKVQFKVINADRKRRRVVGSIRALQRDLRKAAEDAFWSDVEIGKVYTGTVKSITSFGAFVNLGGVDGLVHISELSWKRIKHPSEVVSIGDTLEVYIKDIDAEKKKISLGFKKAEDNPWEILRNQYAIGSVCTVKIVSLTTFGAFAQIIPGVDGLIHVSQISTERVNKPSDVLEVGQEVQAEITEMDFDNKRVSLSMKSLMLAQEATQDEAAQADAQVEAAPVEE